MLLVSSLLFKREKILVHPRLLVCELMGVKGREAR
jgi:hypothetical protein